ncbi:MAG: K+/H+ antiporter subunit F [Burkholderiaceae bacterium]|nr:K+/H+ antiporter subunit F [Burkholderiaceae bacterium]
MLTAIVLPFAIAAFVLALLAAGFRLLAGPSLPDRILALDTLYINALALLIVLGIRLQTTAYFEAALLIAALGFVGTVALARYVLQGDILE